MMAYKLMHRRGEIEVQKVRFGRKTLVTRVIYLSMEPIEAERRKALRQAKQDALMLDDDKWMQMRIGG